MAEADKVLLVVEADAKGAIKDFEVLDAQYTSLGATFAKGEKRAKGAADAHKKLNKQIKTGTKNTTESTVAGIGFLQATEAITSATNQYISGKYKAIDADLASGKITQEEAEQKRNATKQQEKYTGALERGIAVVRFGTAVGMIFNAVQNMTIAGLKKQTIAVLALNGALLDNPILLVVVAAVALAAILIVLEQKFGLVTKGIDAANDAFDKLMDMVNGAKDAIFGLDDAAREFVEGCLEKLSFVGDLIAE